MMKRVYCVLVGIALFGTVLSAGASESVFVSDEFSTGHHAGIVDSGFEALVLRLHLIRRAVTSIDLQSFIWIDDDAGHVIMNECVRAAERGVRVRVLVDQMYSEQDLSVMASLAGVHPNFEMRLYRPPGDRLRSGRLGKLAESALHPYARNQRMHNKVLMVDGAVCVVGGRNLSNHYFGLGAQRNYVDRDVLLTGPLVEDVSGSFEAYWASDFSVPVDELTDVAAVLNGADVWRVEDLDGDSSVIGRAIRSSDDLAYMRETFVSKMIAVKEAWLAVDPPGKKKKADWPYPSTTQALMDVVGAAESTVILQSPYLIMSRRTRTFFDALSRENPALRISVSTNSYASTGNMTHYSGTFRSRAGALETGMNVYELKPDARLTVESGAWGGQIESPNYLSMHAKSLVVDDRIACIGSANLAPRSITLNTEIAVFIDDEAFAQQLRKSIERDMLPANSWVAGMRPMHGAGLNRFIERSTRYLPVDLWPVASTASFDGEQSVGVLPGVRRGSRKHLKFSGYKIVGPLIRPLL